MTVLRGNVTTSGRQTYNDPVALAANVTATSQSGTGDIRFGSSLDGAYDLTARASPSSRVIFGGPVGEVQTSFPLTINAGGKVTMGDVVLNKGMLQVTNGLDSTIAGVVSGRGLLIA